MSNEYDPIVDNWYSHLDKGQLFTVVAISEDSVNIQHFDGDLEELSLRAWRNMNIELSDAPENWSGALDIDEPDDYGTEISDTKPEDWSAPLQEFRQDEEPALPLTTADDWGEGHIEEEPLEGER